MALKDILEQVKNFGLPLVMLALVIWGLYRLGQAVLPFLATRVENWERMTKELIETGQEKWATSAKDFAEVNRKQLELLEKIGRDMDKNTVTLDRIERDVTDIRGRKL